MRVVNEYALNMMPDQSIDLHEGARILHISYKDGGPKLWALVSPDKPTVRTNLRTFRSGEIFNETSFKSDYIGTYVMPDGFVGHVVKIV